MVDNLQSGDFVVISNNGGAEEGALNDVNMEVDSPVISDKFDFSNRLESVRQNTNETRQAHDQENDHQMLSSSQIGDETRQARDQENDHPMLSPSQIGDDFDKRREKAESSSQADTSRPISTNNEHPKDIDRTCSTSIPTTKGRKTLVLRYRTLLLPLTENELQKEALDSMNRQKPKERTEEMLNTTFTKAESISELNTTSTSQNVNKYMSVTDRTKDHSKTKDIATKTEQRKRTPTEKGLEKEEYCFRQKQKTPTEVTSNATFTEAESNSGLINTTSPSKDAGSHMPVTDMTKGHSKIKYTIKNGMSDAAFPPSSLGGSPGLSSHNSEGTLDPSTYELPEDKDDELDLEPREAKRKQSHKHEPVRYSFPGEKHQQIQNFDGYEPKSESNLDDDELKDTVTSEATVIIKAKYWDILKKNSNLLKNMSRHVDISYCNESKTYSVTGSWKDVDAVVSLVAEAYKGYKIQRTVATMQESLRQTRYLQDGASETIHHVSNREVCMPETSSHRQGSKKQNDQVQSIIPQSSYASSESEDSLGKTVINGENQQSSQCKTETNDFNHVQRNDKEGSISAHQEFKASGNAQQMPDKENIKYRVKTTGNEKVIDVKPSETPISTNRTHQNPIKKSSRRHNRTFNNITSLYEQNQLTGNAVVTTEKGLVIQMQKVDILTLKDTDCILICTDERLSSKSGLAGALRSAAGDSYRKACEKKYVLRNECKVTEAGNLPFKKILHVVLSSWKTCQTQVDFSKCIRELKGALVSAFREANKAKMTSISVPAIGTGYLAYPTEKWISAVVETIVEYNNDPKFTKQSLKKIRFADENVGLLVSLGKALRVPFPQASAIHEIDLSRSDRNTFRVTNDFTINVAQGSITHFVGDALAITDDRNLPGYGALAKSVALAAGESYIRERRSANCVDGIVVTGAGDLKCSKIVHVMLSTLPDIKEIGRIVQRILYKANELKMTSIALPLIGTGAFGVSVPAACKIISQVIWDFPADHPNTSLREVCVMDTVGSKIDQLVVELTKLSLSNNASVRVRSSSIETTEGVGQTTPNTRDTAASNSVARSCDCCHDSTKPVEKSFEECGHGICSRCIIPGDWITGCLVCRGNGITNQSEIGSFAASKSTVRDQEDECSICLNNFTQPKTLHCGHVFCEVCINKWFNQGNRVCALCKAVCGTIRGNQPSGTMTYYFETYHNCAGYTRCGSIAILYRFSGGTQDHSHPNPGAWYLGTTRTAYLPDNDEGRKVLRLLRKAFDQGLIFTIGTSVTTGHSDAITWNDIHHKTSRFGGANTYGYPDPTYLTRVQEELKAKGITDDRQENDTAV